MHSNLENEKEYRHFINGERNLPHSKMVGERKSTSAICKQFTSCKAFTLPQI